MNLRNYARPLDGDLIDLLDRERPAPCPANLCVFMPMADVPRRWRPALRRLSLGPVEGAMVRWSYHDGSTWTQVAFEGQRRDPKAIVGWAVFTLQEAVHPIIGVYVSDSHRGQGYGTELVTSLLENCKDKVPAAGRIYAVSAWWPKYSDIVAAAGFKVLDWD